MKQKRKEQLQQLQAIKSEAYQKKYEEYSKLSLEELKILYEDKTKRPGGTYRQAFFDICANKLQEEAIKNKVAKIKEKDLNEIITENTIEVIEEEILNTSEEQPLQEN